ncbi:hypothetical protein RIR_jg22890.t1 [Rhizophagus irregularis DAOM 181602=DAOM 197198]|nr:hypothetical protein RIR_jg22890.t1 [Rhizophagus irregularis DAOM 181602=DAOM 197198]
MANDIITIPLSAVVVSGYFSLKKYNRKNTTFLTILQFFISDIKFWYPILTLVILKLQFCLVCFILYVYLFAGLCIDNRAMFQVDFFREDDNIFLKVGKRFTFAEIKVGHVAEIISHEGNMLNPNSTEEDMKNLGVNYTDFVFAVSRRVIF